MEILWSSFLIYKQVNESSYLLNTYIQQKVEGWTFKKVEGWKNGRLLQVLATNEAKPV